MSQTTLAIPKPQNSFKQVKPKTIVGKGENHYVQQEQQQAQHPRGQGRYEQVQDGSRQRGWRVKATKENNNIHSWKHSFT